VLVDPTPDSLKIVVKEPEVLIEPTRLVEEEQPCCGKDLDARLDAHINEVSLKI
jgi:hypothetical protein